MCMWKNKLAFSATLKADRKLSQCLFHATTSTFLSCSRTIKPHMEKTHGSFCSSLSENATQNEFSASLFSQTSAFSTGTNFLAVVFSLQNLRSLLLNSFMLLISTFYSQMIVLKNIISSITDWLHFLSLTILK